MAIGAPIDASIRRAALLNEARGNVVPDSSTKLADVPQLIMEPGVERFSLLFADGLGLTDDYGNIYEGYAGRTSSTYIWTNQTSDTVKIPGVDQDGTPDPAPQTGNTVIFDEDTGQYRSVPNIDYVQFIIEKPVDRDYSFAMELPYEIEIVDSDYDIETGGASVSFPTGVISKGDPAVITVTGTDPTSRFLIAQITFIKNILPNA